MRDDRLVATISDSLLDCLVHPQSLRPLHLEMPRHIRDHVWLILAAAKLLASSCCNLFAIHCVTC